MNVWEIVVPVVQLPHAQGLELPSYATPGSSGLDLRAAVEESVELKPGERRAIPTGLKLAIPFGFEGQVRPRSGLALHHGVTVINAPGTIDSDYRGELQVLLANLGNETFRIERGDRIAQLVLVPVARASLELVGTLPASHRGEGGFGSTGQA